MSRIKRSGTSNNINVTRWIALPWKPGNSHKRHHKTNSKSNGCSYTQSERKSPSQATPSVYTRVDSLTITSRSNDLDNVQTSRKHYHNNSSTTYSDSSGDTVNNSNDKRHTYCTCVPHKHSSIISGKLQRNNDRTSGYTSQRLGDNYSPKSKMSNLSQVKIITDTFIVQRANSKMYKNHFGNSPRFGTQTSLQKASQAHKKEGRTLCRQEHVEFVKTNQLTGTRLSVPLSQSADDSHYNPSKAYQPDKNYELYAIMTVQEYNIPLVDG